MFNAITSTIPITLFGRPKLRQSRMREDEVLLTCGAHRGQQILIPAQEIQVT
jgi:hypothetical protein